MSSSRVLVGRSRFVLDPVKGSRFIATLGPAHSEAEALALVEEVSAEWPGASHHCWAFLLADGRSRSSDAGEPGGSAGRPILAQLQGHGVEDAVVVVSRWFGGTKLGVGGLIRAYGGCAGKALDAAEILERARTLPLRLRHDYPDTALVQAVLSQWGLAPTETAYGADIALGLQVPEEELEALRRALVDATAGRIRLD